MRPTSDDERISFRPLARGDLTVMADWFADPDVNAWYRASDLEELPDRYGSVIDRSGPVRGWIVRVDGAAAGYVQCSKIAAHSDYARQLDLPEPYADGAFGIDILIGEPRYRNNGWGPVVLRAMLSQIIFGLLEAPSAIIAPELMNERAIHAYERAGFRWLKTVPVTDEDPDNTEDEYVTIITDEYVMGITRADFDRPTEPRGTLR